MTPRAFISKPLLTKLALLLMMVVAPVFLWGQVSLESVWLEASPEGESSLLENEGTGGVETLPVKQGRRENKRPVRTRTSQLNHGAVRRRPPFTLVADLRPVRPLPPARGPTLRKPLLRLLN